MTAIPGITSAAYRAAAHLHKSGPLTTTDLYAQVEFPTEPSRRAQVMTRAFSNGWLIATPRGIDLGDLARKHFNSLVPQDEPEPSAKVPYIGIAAAPRTPLIPLYERPQLSAKFRVSSAGFRDDVPAFSVRECVRFSTLGGRTA